VTNCGKPSTFREASFAVESHILDFEPMELGEETPLSWSFCFACAAKIEWPSPEALKAQIFGDIARAKRYFPAGAVR